MLGLRDTLASLRSRDSGELTKHIDQLRLDEHCSQDSRCPNWEDVCPVEVNVFIWSTFLLIDVVPPADPVGVVEL